MAVQVFALVARFYPESWNAWDSLAEAHMTDGDHTTAVEYYHKSLALNPGNSNARDMLRRLEGDH